MQNHMHDFFLTFQSLKDNLEIQRAYATLGRTYLFIADSKAQRPLQQRVYLESAMKHFDRSLEICKHLHALRKIELDEIKARLNLNIGG